MLIDKSMHIAKIATLVSLSIACSGSVNEDRGQEGRIDGSVQDDGAFNSIEAKEEYCADHDDWFCSDTGSVEQAWTSAEYHGKELSTGRTCYGPNSAGNGCMFPAQNKFRVKVTTAGCFTGPPPPNGPSTLQEQSMLDAMRNGAKAWNGAGGLIVVDDGSPGSSNYQLLTISCGACTVPGCLAEGGSGPETLSAVVSNLPVGPHGKDQGAAYAYKVTFITMNTANTWADIVNKCSSGGVTNGEIIARATALGMHEAGHVYGFAHFNAGSIGTNIMYPFSADTCSPAISIQQVYKDALAAFSPTGGSATITDVNLENKTPQ